MKRVLTALLIMAMMLSLSMSCLAAQPDDYAVSPRYTHISTNKVGLTINETTGVASVSSYCYTVGQYTVGVECRLQRYTGSFWSTVKTWSASGTRYASVNENWAVYSGYTYRAYVIFTVRDSAGNLLESATSSDSYVYPKR